METIQQTTDSMHHRRSTMDAVEIIIIILSSVLVIAVFAYSIRQNKDEKRPPVDFIREFFNHFGDGSNFRR
jgi:hypothetical protein